MRALWASIVIAALCSLAVGDDVGVPARSSAVEYPVQQDVKKGTIAAAIVSPDQVGKRFSSEIAKKYIVVEVAVYPAPGQSFDVEPLDFLLRVGDYTSHSELPLVGKPWPGSPAPPPPPPQSPGPDPYWLEQQLRAKALGRGLTPTPIAGYLFFR